MINKFIVTIIVPVVEMEYDIYIPNNKMIGTIKKYIVTSINELTLGTFNKEPHEVNLVDRENGMIYLNGMYVKDTGIKNGSKLIVM